jgi:hypothetical protein
MDCHRSRCLQPQGRDSSFAGVTEDATVLSFDRRQRGTFRKSFEEPLSWGDETFPWVERFPAHGPPADG